MTKEEIKEELHIWHSMVTSVDADIHTTMDKDFVVSLVNLVAELDWYDSHDLVSKDDCKNAISSVSNKFARLWVGDAYKAIDKLPKIEPSKEI